MLMWLLRHFIFHGIRKMELRFRKGNARVTSYCCWCFFPFFWCCVSFSDLFFTVISLINNNICNIVAWLCLLTFGCNSIWFKFYFRILIHRIEQSDNFMSVSFLLFDPAIRNESTKWIVINNWIAPQKIEYKRILTNQNWQQASDRARWIKWIIYQSKYNGYASKL